MLVLERLRLTEVLVYQPEQVHKRRTEGVTERAAIADVEHPHDFLTRGLRVPELRRGQVKVEHVAFSSQSLRFLRFFLLFCGRFSVAE